MKFFSLVVSASAQRRHKRVVVRVEGLVSLATMYMPKECLERI
ncbi:MAG: hypothetical protein EZS26_000273 [Candidatus Ordinivivax streblomastigis]|uniref:Uncharacterized protein n=1 Tax=Candidatus Ordinivivax streblomastigis TaxID=2540710 RepID=A0A5M8P5Y7_9BACT|nr:MAG: hypothetical protein EZS26_000273 [Candidatus Ordinivivax streblomastigis]